MIIRKVGQQELVHDTVFIFQGLLVIFNTSRFRTAFGCLVGSPARNICVVVRRNPPGECLSGISSPHLTPEQRCLQDVNHAGFFFRRMRD